MLPEIVGREGPFAGQRFPLYDTPFTFGRRGDNSVVVPSPDVSRRHAEIRCEAGGHVLYDLGSSNGTYVNGERVNRRVLHLGDVISIAGEVFGFEPGDPTRTAVLGLPRPEETQRAYTGPDPILRVTISGGGPVGLSLALLLDRLLSTRVAVTVYDGRWIVDGDRVVWKDERHGNTRRQQVVTVQSRQYLNLPEDVQARLFTDGAYSHMWPAGPDSIHGHGPRNVRIAHLEDTLLAMANERCGRIRLVPETFEPVAQRDVAAAGHVLAICEGSRSKTREHFTAKFGVADRSIYSLDGRHVQDVVLGLQVASRLPDPMSVLLTVAQNRFLLNSLHGKGFLNMRLTDEEAQEVVGIDPVKRQFTDCIASRPCVMARDDHGDYRCGTHDTFFLPSLIRGSALWKRVGQGLALFAVPEKDLTAVTAFRLDMVQRPRFTAHLYAPTATTPGTYGFLLGDAANAIHFWPGRGLNSGLASAISLARSLAGTWVGRPFRDADFTRHEAAMSMLQYRHKSRAWKSMVRTGDDGITHAIKAQIADSLQSGPDEAGHGRDGDLEVFMQRLTDIRRRLTSRLPGLPDDATLRTHLGALRSETLRTLVASGPWDTLTVGGEEVDVDIFYRDDMSVLAQHPALPGQHNDAGTAIRAR